MKKIFTSVFTITLIIFVFSLAVSAQTHRKTSKPKTQTAKVLINEQGYSPGSLRLRRGIPARITFLRTTERTCGTEIVIPAFGINRPLPLDQPVTVRFTPRKTGEFGFTCGMNMMRGKLIIT